MKILSIVIPSYNTEKYIRECVPSFLEESFLNYIELLFVNDGSTDHTESMLKEYEALYPDSVRVITKKNGGHGSAVNTGIREASGRYFKVVDGDDWVDTCELGDFVEKLLGLRKQYDLILTPFRIVNEKEGFERIDAVPQYSYNRSYDLKEILDYNTSIEIHSITYRTALLQEHQIKLDENMFYVDQEYDLFPLVYVKRVLFLNHVITQYRLGTQEQSMNLCNLVNRREMHKNMLCNVIQYFEKHTCEETLKKYVRNRISIMIDMQLKIYAQLKNKKTSRNELAEFVKDIHQHFKPDKKYGLYRFSCFYTIPVVNILLIRLLDKIRLFNKTIRHKP